MTSLPDELRSLPPDLTQRLAAHHFDGEKLAQFATALARGQAIDNRVKGKLAPPEPADIVDLTAAGSAVSMPYAISAGPSTRSAVETTSTLRASTSCQRCGLRSEPSRRSERARICLLSSLV